MYRGYGVILPSSFTRVLPNAFGCSPSTPVSDCGTGRRFVPGGLFAAAIPLDFQIGCCRPCGTGASITPIRVLAASPVGSPFSSGWRNINRLSIGYALGPRLRSRLTLGGLTFPRKPCAFGGGASHPPCRYSFRHSHSPALHRSFPSGFTAAGDALLPSLLIRDCGATLSPRHFRRGMARPVSCYALLKWWLLLSQHPGCQGDPTSFLTERRFGGLGRRSGLFPSRARSLSPAL